MKFINNFKKNNFIGIRIEDDIKQRLEAQNINISALVRSLLIEYLETSESKPFQLKRSIRNTKKQLKDGLNTLRGKEKDLQEYQDYINGLHKELETLNSELVENDIPEVKEYTDNETLNNLIENRIVKPFHKSRFNNIIDFLNENYHSIKRTANRFGLKVSFEELKQILEKLEFKPFSNNNNNNNNNNNLLYYNNKRKYISECLTVKSENVKLLNKTDFSKHGGLN